jgi:hypothetical protein
VTWHHRACIKSRADALANLPNRANVTRDPFSRRAGWHSYDFANMVLRALAAESQQLKSIHRFSGPDRSEYFIPEEDHDREAQVAASPLDC